MVFETKLCTHVILLRNSICRRMIIISLALNVEDRKNDICQKFELIATGGAKYNQASRLGIYQKHSSIANNRISYFNEEKNQYLFWIAKDNTPGYWMVSDIHIFSKYPNGIIFSFESFLQIIYIAYISFQVRPNSRSG